MIRLTVHRQWEDETVRERTGHLPSYAEAKKMLILHECRTIPLDNSPLDNSPSRQFPSPFS